MQKTPSTNLSKTILALEDDIKRQESVVQSSLHDFANSLQPRNLVRSAVQDVVSSPQARAKVLKVGVGIIGTALLRNLLPKGVNAIVGMIASRFLSGKSKTRLWKQ